MLPQPLLYQSQFRRAHLPTLHPPLLLHATENYGKQKIESSKKNKNFDLIRGGAKQPVSPEIRLWDETQNENCCSAMKSM